MQNGWNKGTAAEKTRARKRSQTGRDICKKRENGRKTRAYQSKTGAGADGEAYSPFYRSVPRLDTRPRVG